MSDNNKEDFWGGGGSYTPVHNRLYNAPPFGWESYNNPTDFPRFTENPYSSSTLTKLLLNKESSNLRENTLCPDCDITESFSIPTNYNNIFIYIVVIFIIASIF